ncbi:unnamed protein product [Brugia timori]|uniref:ZP domain-containing protein n=1 Tax=Brugia timori TaxID=42155 RepID=A0A0R3Q7A5_9BILA|nr:unnamed protein product [Brugia timori]
MFTTVKSCSTSESCRKSSFLKINLRTFPSLPTTVTIVGCVKPSATMTVDSIFTKVISCEESSVSGCSIAGMGTFRRL